MAPTRTVQKGWWSQSLKCPHVIVVLKKISIFFLPNGSRVPSDCAFFNERIRSTIFQNNLENIEMGHLWNDYRTISSGSTPKNAPIWWTGCRKGPTCKHPNLASSLCRTQVQSIWLRFGEFLAGANWPVISISHYVIQSHRKRCLSLHSTRQHIAITLI